jgi:fucose permease
MKDKTRLFLPCYFAFFVNGAMVLLVGAILPYLIEEAGMNYSMAGGLLSAFAIGNLLASFVNPILAPKIGRKATIVCLSALIPISFFMITLRLPVTVFYVAFLLAGIGRGSVSIINNAVINDNSAGRPAALSLLHMTFAVGAFIAPFLTSVYIGAGLGWRAIVYTIICGSTLATIGYSWMKIDYNWPSEGKKMATASDDGAVARVSFYRSPTFYIMGFLLFLYLGLENCVNGWFVTYFKSMGIMSSAYATNLVSITWVMVMLGRLLTAKLSTFINKNKLIVINCIATALFFILLISTKNLAVITAAIVGLGFFFAGIYPTSVSSAGNVLKGSTTGMSMFLALAALGGIITPQLVGMVADRTGMVLGIVLLAFNAAGMLILSIVNYVMQSGRKVVK